MSLRCTSAVLVILAWLAGGPASAQESPSDPLSGDPRLKQNVRLHVEGQALDEVLALLSKDSGVKLSAEPYVADDKIVAVGPARPLKEILGDVAALFNNTWRRTRDRSGSFTYLLVRSREARANEDHLALGRFREVAARLDEQVAALGESPQQLAQRPENDLIRHYLTMPDGRLGTQLYAALNPQQRARFLAQGRLFVPFNGVPPNLQGAVAASFKQQIAEQNSAVFTVTGADPGGAAETGIVLSPDEKDRPETLQQDGLRFHLRDAFSSVIPQIGIGKRSTIPIAQVRLRPPSLPLHGHPYTGAPVANPESLPTELQLTEAAKAGRGRGWVDQLCALSEKCGIPVIADFYRSPPTQLAPPSLDARLHPRVSALNAFCGPQGYLWWTSGKTLLVRKRDWYQQRRYEVPDRWLVSVTQRLTQHKGTPTYGDVLLLQTLTTPQLAGLRAAVGSESLYDEYDFAGLPELFGLLRNTVRSLDAPVMSIEAAQATPTLESGVSIAGRDLTPPKQKLIQSFLESLPYTATSKAATRFGIYLTASRFPAEGSAPPKPLLISMSWRLDNGAQSIILLSLPQVLTDDRRSRTVVALVDE